MKQFGLRLEMSLDLYSLASSYSHAFFRQVQVQRVVRKPRQFSQGMALEWTDRASQKLRCVLISVR